MLQNLRNKLPPQTVQYPAILHFPLKTHTHTHTLVGLKTTCRSMACPLSPLRKTIQFDEESRQRGADKDLRISSAVGRIVVLFYTQSRITVLSHKRGRHMYTKSGVQWSPLIRSTDVRSFRMYCQFLAGPNQKSVIMSYNPDARSACL